jgi:membrane-associated protease RseP (regulator of RpoE activity)
MNTIRKPFFLAILASITAITLLPEPASAQVGRGGRRGNGGVATIVHRGTVTPRQSPVMIVGQGAGPTITLINPRQDRSPRFVLRPGGQGGNGGSPAIAGRVATPQTTTVTIGGQGGGAQAQYPGRLGVEVTPVDGRFLGEPFSPNYQALWVLGVLPGSPAQLAGLVPGDVIVAANNQFTPTVSDLSRVVAGTYSSLYLVAYRRNPAGWQGGYVVVSLPPGPDSSNVVSQPPVTIPVSDIRGVRGPAW